ncbi:hypothetical protein Hdeb2414_s0017g00500431 [Helianthus debilis subsp. tardiflorus]
MSSRAIRPNVLSFRKVRGMLLNSVRINLEVGLYNKMAKVFNHMMNFQEFGEKNRRRSELVLEPKKLFEELKIKCNLLPQYIHLHKPETTSGPTK